MPPMSPYASHATSYPRQLLFTFAFLPLSSISTLIKMLQKKNDPLPLIRVATHYHSPNGIEPTT